MEAEVALRRQIDTAEELRSVTGTMKSLAAVTIRQYERAALALREYARTVELGLQVVLRELPMLAEPREPAAEAPALVIVFGSAQGLCGPVNRHLAAHAHRVVQENGPGPGARDRDGSTLVVASGTRVAGELEAVGLPPREVLGVPSSAEGITARVEELLVRLDELRRGERVERVLLVHPRPLPGRRGHQPVTVPLLPLDPARLAELAAEPWPTRVLPQPFTDWRAMFRALTRQLTAVSLHRAHAETETSVHAARLAAMQAAEDNIQERLEHLHMRYNRQRQAAITSELLDVVSGYEAAGGPAELNLG